MEYRYQKAVGWLAYLAFALLIAVPAHSFTFPHVTASDSDIARPAKTAADVGILNVTPDSFSDGGRFDSVDSAVQHALAMARQGAAMIDVGGESTRPGAQRIGADAQAARVVPVISAGALLPSMVMTTS